MFENVELLVLGSLFAIVHFVSPYAAKYRERFEPHFSSLAGGFAVAYIFLELLPSLEVSHDLVGERIYFLILLGFSVFYGIEFYMERYREKKAIARVRNSIIMAQAFLYNLLLAIAIGEEAPETVFLALLFAILISFHLLSNDLGLIEELEGKFIKYGRFVLILAIILGIAIHFISEPSIFLMDVIAALVAGIILYRVSQSELPEFDRAHFVSFVVGSLFFIVIHLLLVEG
ncbi:MAG: hypothetical protein SAL07_11780 [Oscillatoria sp. PMC 1051.18]|nr:hypothetical protein [Oscillatoria sp. PMC 1050.18]MEC5030588.1 hypothetical protein [Oscillatoria sp. PMC 1051.18]